MHACAEPGCTCDVEIRAQLQKARTELDEVKEMNHALNAKIHRLQLLSQKWKMSNVDTWYGNILDAVLNPVGSIHSDRLKE